MAKIRTESLHQRHLLIPSSDGLQKGEAKKTVPPRATAISQSPRKWLPMRKVPRPGKTVALSPRQFRAASVLARIGGSEDLLIGNHGRKESHRNGDKKSDQEAEDAQQIDGSEN